MYKRDHRSLSDNPAENSVIDLTNSFIYENDNIPVSVSNVVSKFTNIVATIVLDDSRDGTTVIEATESTKIIRRNSSRSCSKVTSTPKKDQEPAAAQKRLTKQQSVLGDCPICWEELGKNPLASTKCGHIFCYNCLEKAVKNSRTCPTCRHALVGKNAFHPLYLNVN